MRRGAMAMWAAVAAVVGAMGATLGGCGNSGPAPIRTAGRQVVVTPAAPLQLLTQSNTTQIYTAGGKPGSKTGPILVVVRSGKVFQREEARKIGPETFINESEDLRGPNGFVTSAFAAGGLEGYATECDATKDQRKVRVYCSQLFAADGTHTLFGYAPADDAAGFAAIKTTAASLMVP